jgi:hypothetical protein
MIGLLDRGRCRPKSKYCVGGSTYFRVPNYTDNTCSISFTNKSHQSHHMVRFSATKKLNFDDHFQSYFRFLLLAISKLYDCIH